jgi:HSP20 family protein
MRLTNWNPFAEMNGLLNRMAGAAALPRLLAENEGGIGVQIAPAADVGETATEYLVRAELPGVAKENVKVTLEGGLVTIEGECAQQKEQDEKFHVVERFYGKFARAFALPDNVKADAVRCEFEDGVLTVHLPKVERQVPRAIPVH